MLIGPEIKYSFVDPDFPFRISRNADETLIALPFYRILFLKEGPLLLLSRNEKRIIEGKSALFFPPDVSESEGKASRNYSVKAGRLMKADSVSFNQHLLDRLTISCWKNKSLQDFITGCWNSGNPEGPKIFSISSFDLLSSYLKGISAEYLENPPAWENCIMQYLIRIFIHIYREQTSIQELKQGAVWQINDALSFIHENYAEQFSLADMAEKYSFSPGYFSRIFRERTGQPLFEYINNIRIQRACILLKKSSQTITEIAFAVGYNNISFFNRYFRKLIKMSPREYRSSIRR